jgi:hypothetical protein
MTFLSFWVRLNITLALRGEPEALHEEARRWYDWRPVKKVDERLVNRCIHGRKPI